MLVVTQVLSMLQSLALGILTLSRPHHDSRGAWSLQALQGVINAFDTPARQAFVVEMVDDRGRSANAIALNSSLVNGSRIIGPAVGGAIIAAVGEGWCFMRRRASSYIAVHRLARRHARAAVQAGRRDDAGAASRWPPASATCASFTPVRSGLLLVALVSLLGMPYQVLMPVMAIGRPRRRRAHARHADDRDRPRRARRHALSRVAARGRRARPPDRAGEHAFGLALLVFSLSRNLWLSLLVLPICGAGFMISLAATNTIVQTLVPEHLRGRVMAFYTMAFLGTAPIGSLIAGSGGRADRRARDDRGRRRLRAWLAGSGSTSICRSFAS